MHRDRKLLDLAHRVEWCQLRISPDCKGATPDGCEPAHVNSGGEPYGKGMGVKAHDVFHCAACRACHDLLDGRTKGRPLSFREDWQIGFARTLLYYFERGWLKVVT